MVWESKVWIVWNDGWYEKLSLKGEFKGLLINCLGYFSLISEIYCLGIEDNI